MLKGITPKPLKRACDERGCFTEIMRQDWKELLGQDQPVQTNFSTTYPGIIRAWHRHKRGQVDYFIVLKGALKICAYDEETKELDELISTGLDLQVLRMPGHYWHGYKAVGNENALLVYFTTKLYDYASPDEERRPWNDPKIVPKIINGKKDDPRTGKPWDWNLPPYK
ncbi:MAG: dTDP-4-dehydrorhamnose 3,5-epimerase family protein [Candidatus Bathyarchaeia archaeon]|jgi:dTDP-4-dehydrorhamnose 3,5-epimerase